MAIDLCSCHGQPLTWCPNRATQPVITTPDISYLGEPEPGVVFQTYHPAECGICGGPIVIGEQVVRLPAPTYGYQLGHAYC